VARDRKRAKRRKERRPPQGGGTEPDHLHREMVPGAWEHGGEVDRFEAELVAGAGGEPIDEPGDVERESLGGEEPADESRAEALAATGRAAPAEPRRREGPRVVNFLRAVWAELQRVQWPDRRQVGQATMVVLGFVLLAGAYLGLADYIATQILDAIL
jgi:preprotein translocase subunit SecE